MLCFLQLFDYLFWQEYKNNERLLGGKNHVLRLVLACLIQFIFRNRLNPKKTSSKFLIKVNSSILLFFLSLGSYLLFIELVFYKIKVLVDFEKKIYLVFLKLKVNILEQMLHALEVSFHHISHFNFEFFYQVKNLNGTHHK